ncbi:hypothetical protein [Aquibacillus rhizosphaerae]|uniref:Haemolysin XhlA n=1 Tax=Aquibacillus rhizosphaerae TaxID=3051431 RepID=A0ABT7L1R2_9BACI|nr:hypothetical protein [Aquibacillus sp. LR5S19]MDL4839747.1 hypothetical protein [Aquibacillus sp. LR5S19]
MEKDTERQILEELKNINRSLQGMNEKIDSIDDEGKTSSIIWDIIKSLLIGFLILGPGIAVAMGLFQLIHSWFF